MKYARIDNGVVHEVIDFDPTGRFHPSIIFVPAPDTVREGQLRQGVEFVDPPAPPVPEISYKITLEDIIEILEQNGSATVKTALANKRNR